MQLHTSLGPGLLKNTYKECLYYRILQAGIMAEKEKPIPLIFEGVKLECGYRLDILVENKLVLELKFVECFNETHLAQTLT